MDFCRTLLLFAISVACCSAADDNRTVDKRAIESGREVLSKSAWYDPDADSIQSVPLAPSGAEELNRGSRWDPRPKKKAAAKTPAPATPTTPAGGTGGSFNFGAFFGWTLLVLLIAAVTAIVVYAFISREPSIAGEPQGGVQREDQDENLPSRLEQLPVRIEISQGDLMSQARDLAARGRFDLAIIYLFSQTLLQLDRRHRIRLSLGKTNRQYLRELREAEMLRGPMSEIVETFESSYFGGHAPTAGRFTQCLELYQRIENELRQAATTVAVLLCLTWFTGCTRSLDTTYGRTRGGSATQSINGLSGMREIFEAYGWETKDDRRLSERLEKAKTLVWIPQPPAPQLMSQVAAPTSDQLQWFNNWLVGQSGRTLIYVCPSYDAEADYFESARAVASGVQKLEYRRRRARLITDNATNLSKAGVQVVNCPWFSITEIHPHYRTQQLDGEFLNSSEPRLTVTARVDPVKEIEVNGNYKLGAPQAASANPDFIHVPTKFTPAIIDSKGNTLAGIITDETSWKDSQMIVVACPSFLVNFSLVDPANRELASELVASCGEPGRVVVLESQFALPIRKTSGEPPRPSGMEWFTAWPLNLVTFHLVTIGVIVLIGLFPIFGRAKRLRSASRTDFGRHLTAVGELMHRTGDVAAARLRISEYFEHVRDEPDSPWVIRESKNKKNPTPVSPTHEPTNKL